MHCLEQHLSKLAALRDKAEQLGKMGDAISAEVSRGRALGYYIERRESGAAGAFQAKTLAGLRDEARAAGRFGDAISAEVNRGRALGY